MAKSGGNTQGGQECGRRDEAELDAKRRWTSSRACRELRRFGQALTKIVTASGALIDAGTPPAENVPPRQPGANPSSQASYEVKCIRSLKDGATAGKPPAD